MSDLEPESDIHLRPNVFNMALATWVELNITLKDVMGVLWIQLVQWAIFCDMTHVIFYIDCKGVMDTISDPKANFFELGSIVSECRSLQLAKCNAYKLHNSLLA